MLEHFRFNAVEGEKRAWKKLSMRLPQASAGASAMYIDDMSMCDSIGSVLESIFLVP